MQAVLLTCAYLVSSVLFILSLRGLSSPETSRKGNLRGVLGMTIAVGATLTVAGSYGLALSAVVIGGSTGVVMALRVPMTSMPEMVALLHSFVGLAAVLVGYASYLGHAPLGEGRLIHQIEVYLAVLIGAITFTGSVVAFLKLKGTLGGRPTLLPARHLLNLSLVSAIVWLGLQFVPAPGSEGLLMLLLATLVALALGVHLVAAIGGADMPVVVSLLNSYSGWTASAAGFMLNNDLLIVTGALVGSSGAILSIIMCRAMNRSILSVVFGGFGAKPPSGAPAAAADASTAASVVEATVASTAQSLLAAKRVIIVPGYGMAVARAQHAVREVTDLLRARDIEVRFAVHPVAGRLPGHMNVLLAEAAVPYDIVFEMDEVNDDFPRTDVVLVIGANDIVNPAAQDDPTSPIYGMPVLEVWNAAEVFMLKRSRAAGYAGIDNPLFYRENTRMLFGDALQSMQGLVRELPSA